MAEPEEKVKYDPSGHSHEDLSYQRDGYGAAITCVYSLTDGSLWIGNGEYGSEVRFCPECGFKSKNYSGEVL
jgi:hypothetical protein